MSDPCSYTNLSRRSFLAGAATLATANLVPRVASAAGARDPRLVTIVLRGALDGLATVVPVGDPNWGRLRDDAKLSPDGAASGANGLPLESLFVLNPAMPKLHDLYRRGEASFVHAVATPYRARSHFDGQQVLESGLPDVVREPTGWMNRLMEVIPASGMSDTRQSGLAVGPTVPLILRGAAPVTAWSPMGDAVVAPDTLERLLALYDLEDPALHEAFASAVDTRRLVETMGPGTMADQSRALKGIAKHYSDAARGAARLLRQPEGPRLAALSFDGWDTHANEGVVSGRLSRLLAGLDGAVDTLRTELGAAWRDTVVLVVTEFGRTAYENGNDGTDHGTGSVTMLVGGAIRGNTVIADWPGLADKDLFANRDLKPTADLHSIMRGVVKEAFDASDSQLATIFPNSSAGRNSGFTNF